MEIDLVAETSIHVRVLDTQTGKTYSTKQGRMGLFTPYWWMEGNGSCDCNRALLFNEGREGDCVGHCHGEARYLVVAVDPLPDGLTLEDFNIDYPGSLVREYLAKSWPKP